MDERDDINFWKLADEKVRRNLPVGVYHVSTLRGHKDWIGRIAWSPDGRILASPSGDGTIRLWKTDTWDCTQILSGHAGDVNLVVFNNDGTMLASCCSKGYTHIWETKTGNNIKSFVGYNNWIDGLAFDLASSKIATADGDGLIRIYDLQSNQNVKLLQGQQTIGNTILFNPIDGSLGSVDQHHIIKFWDISTGELKRTLVGHTEDVYSISIDPSRDKIASAGFDQTIKIWDNKSGQLLRSLEGHTGMISSISWSFDGSILASKSKDHSIRFWRPESGECILIVKESSSSQYYWPPGLIFHPKSLLIATVGTDPSVHNYEDNITYKQILKDTNSASLDRIIHIYNIEDAVLLNQPVYTTVSISSAKVVIIGESNVGKSFLAHRIANGSPPIAGMLHSTHGMKFWSLDAERLNPKSTVSFGERREVVLWDMGGQPEYRLIHQLFLHDTTLALVLFDPSRGINAFKEVEMWNKYFLNQTKGRLVVKFLVGSKIDLPNNTIDRQRVDSLLKDLGFDNYYETSSITGRGVVELCEAISNAIDWEDLGKTKRPELFQRIRDEIEVRRSQGEVVLYISDLHRALKDHISQDDDLKSLDTVTRQLATQGFIARTHVSSGEPVLVLQVQEIERYAGSLIMTARKNPRGIPALDIRSIVQPDFPLPGVNDNERLPRNQEKPVLECTVQLMLDHGICFEHEGLLVFPTLFDQPLTSEAEKLPHSVSLYYDFEGAIDNIYASLVAWLVLAQNFGRVRLWADRVEFEVKDGGLCGLRKIVRPGGFAHLDIYFESVTPEKKRREFIIFVENHLSKYGIEIQEHIEIKCICGYQLEEEILRKRIALGEKDVSCPVCELRHSLTEGSHIVKRRDSRINQRTFALRTKIEKRRRKTTKQVVKILTKTDTKPLVRPIRILHLSDLHFNGKTNINTRLRWLNDDVKLNSGLGFKELDYLVITGDFTDKGCFEGFEKAYEFVSHLMQEFNLSAERCIFVPGNHDASDINEAYRWCDNVSGLNDNDWIKEGNIFLVRNQDHYPLRFRQFSDSFFHKFIQLPYPLDFCSQGFSIPFWETGIQFLAFNSAYQIDQFHRKRSGINIDAVATAIKLSQEQEKNARHDGFIAEKKQILRIAVWHHPLTGPDQIKDQQFLSNLQKNGVKLILHGDVHQMTRDQIGYKHSGKLHIIGSGSFGASAACRPESVPRLYNVLEIERDLKSIRVYTRKQSQPDNAWDGWNEWEGPFGGPARFPYYDIAL